MVGCSSFQVLLDCIERVAQLLLPPGSGIGDDRHDAARDADPKKQRKPEHFADGVHLVARPARFLMTQPAKVHRSLRSGGTKSNFNTAKISSSVALARHALTPRRGQVPNTP